MPTGLEVIKRGMLECLPCVKSSVVRLNWLVAGRGRKRRELAFSENLLVTITALPCEVGIITRWGENQTNPTTRTPSGFLILGRVVVMEEGEIFIMLFSYRDWFCLRIALY